MAVLVVAAAGAAAEPPPFALEVPAFLRGPDVSRSLMGATYAFRARQPEGHTRLMITTMPTGEIRARFGALTDLECVKLFLEELARSHERFFVVAMTRPLAVGPGAFLRFRWNGEKDGRDMTGVLSCGELAGHYYVVHFVDEIKQATRTFPAIRASLRALSARAD